MDEAQFDVLVVYTDRLAISAGTFSAENNLPFAVGSSSESYSVVYSYFLKICEKYGLSAAFTTSADIIGPGTCKSYWIFKDNSWIAVQRKCFSKLIFDKFSPTNDKIKDNRILLFSSNKIKSFNSPYLFDLFFDKQKTYDELSAFSVPTVAIEKGTTSGVNKACKTLKQLIKKHPKRTDFSREIVMKDRFGAGGISVFRFKIGQTKKIVETLKRHKNKSFIIQSFISFDKGFTYNNSPVSTDIRLIYLGDKTIQTYIRMAKKGDFRCNEHQGGTLKYISKRVVPKCVFDTAKRIVKVLDKKSSVYALDFIISNSGNVYLLEGNTGPGLDWDLSKKVNEIEAKKLIRIIVKQLSKLAKPEDIYKGEIEPMIIIPVTREYPVSTNQPLSI